MSKENTKMTPENTKNLLELLRKEDNFESDKKSRQSLSRENILSSFDEIISTIDLEINNDQEFSKSKQVKFLKSLKKQIKTLNTQVGKAVKDKTKTPRATNTTSGFKKPVKISKDLAKFTGWNEDELYSRVDVTKYICDYIQNNNLQNPSDKRNIIPDSKLQKLLGFDPNSDESLKYYNIQSCLKNQNHFPKD